MSVSVLQPSSAQVDQPYEPQLASRQPSAAFKLASAKATSMLAPEAKYDDFRDTLFKDGVAVLPGVISKDKAAAYVSRAHDWLESFDLGYDRADPSTWKIEHLPANWHGGLYATNGICHSQLAWDIRQEAGVIDAFKTIWGTDELLVSFDGLNIGVPLDLEDGSNKKLDVPWAHTDQSPLRPDLQCIQGIVNLAENGPLDGGLTVFRGSVTHFNELFRTFDCLKPADGWPEEDWYMHKPEMLDWLKERGCYWEKICAPPGALILWDSRAVHYGAIPLAKTARVASYVCYKPAALATEETIQAKRDAFAKLSGTSHDPVKFTVRSIKPEVEGDKAWEKIKDHLPAPPVLTSVGRKLAGLESY